MTVQASTSYQSYRNIMEWIREAVLLVLGIAAIIAAISAIWALGTVVRERSVDGGQEAYIIILCVVGLIGGAFSTFAAFEASDGKHGSTFVMGAWITTAVLWVLAGFYFLCAGVHHPVEEGELRLQRSGEVVYANGRATRGLYRKWSVPISTSQEYTVSATSTALVTSRKIEIVLQTDVVFLVTLKPGAELDRFLTATALVPNGVRDHANDYVWSSISSKLDPTFKAVKLHIDDYPPGAIVKPPYPWIEKIEVLRAQSSVTQPTQGGQAKS